MKYLQDDQCGNKQATFVFRGTLDKASSNKGFYGVACMLRVKGSIQVPVADMTILRVRFGGRLV